MGCENDMNKSSCSDQSSCCDSKSGCCTDKPPSQEEMFEMFVCLAEEAWRKAFKQKMVDIYLKSHGKEMVKMAEFFTEAAGLKWMNYEEFEKKKPEFMKQFMGMGQKKKK